MRAFDHGTGEGDDKQGQKPRKQMVLGSGVLDDEFRWQRKSGPSKALFAKCRPKK